MGTNNDDYQSSVNKRLGIGCFLLVIVFVIAFGIWIIGKL
jgi:hypothetical protein